MSSGQLENITASSTVNPLKDGSLPCFHQGRGRVWTCTYRSLENFNAPFSEEALLVSTPSPTSHLHKTQFPVIKMFPELRSIWKVLENPTGRRRGQKSSSSHASQEALHKIFALQDSQLRSSTCWAREPLEIRAVLWGSGVLHKPFIKSGHFRARSVYVNQRNRAHPRRVEGD